MHHTDDFLGIAPEEMEPGDAHRLLLHSVAPRPIAFVSTLSDAGVPNLAPFSYFMAGGANPLSIAFSPISGRGGEPKDTLRNVRALGEYVVCAVTWEMRDRMMQASADLPYGSSEWAASGFTPAPSARVRPPRVLESPFALECVLFQVVQHGTGHLAANYVIGEVVYFHVARRLMPDGVLDPRLVDYVGRLGGNWYSRADAPTLFEMTRPPRPR